MDPSSHSNPSNKPSASKTDYDSTITSSTSIHTDAKNAKARNREDASMEAFERRRIWAMAAASAAEMLKELTQKSPPTLDDMKKAFAPITPSEWAEKRQAVGAQSEVENEEITDAQVAEELFYDPDATDDDIGAFLGQSDKDLKSRFRGSTAGSKGSFVAAASKGRKHSKAQVGFRKSGGHVAPMPAAPKMEKASEAIRKSLEAGAKEGDTQDNLRPKSSSFVTPSSQHSDNDTPEQHSVQESAQNLRHSNEAEAMMESNRKASMQTLPSQKASDDDFFYVYQDTTETTDVPVQDETTDESEVEIYFPADVSINVDESLVGLESLLDDMKLESRITERFKYKLINKYSLLLQALITYQERETETITHLQTKRKILSALHQFVKTEAEAAAKAVITEEEKEEEKDELGQGLDLGGALDDGQQQGDANKKKDSQGLSIEEMPAATIRETLLQQKNRLDVLEAIKKIHVLQLKQLEFERTLLNLHYSRMVKPSDLSKEIKDSRRLVNDLQLEISSVHQEMGQVQNEMRIQEKQIIEEEKSVEKLELEALTKQGEVQVLANKPVHVAKEADREAQKLEQLQDTHDVLCTRFMDSMEIYRTNQSKVDVLAAELTSLTKMENKLTQQKKAATRDHEVLLGQMEALMAREHLMLDRATMLTERMQHLIKQKKRIQEEQHRMFNDANKSLREAQKLERSIRIASDAFINARLAYDKMRAAFDAVKPTDQNSNWEKLSRMLQKEIINLKASLDKKLDEANYKSGMVAKLQAKLNALYEQQVSSGKELQDLIRQTVRKRREREEKAEQCIKLEGQIQKIVLEKKAREIGINDCLRSEKIIMKQLGKIQKRFNTLKMEKSAIINELSAARVKLQETKAKTDDLRNKLNAYITQTQMFESMTKEKYYIILNARIKRDSIKNDAMRSRQKFRFYRNQKMEVLLNNKTLRRETEKQRQESIVIRKEFEKATNAADEFAIGYRIRMEEICTFHEYIYCYRKILLKGSEEITIREMEKSKLNALYEETRKHVFIVQMNQPDETEYFNKIERLREKFYAITRERRDLEIKLNDDDNPARVREIDFDKIKEKENLEVLEKRLDNREEYLAVRDVIGLERNMMENHLTKIAEDSLEQALYLKDYYGEQVKAIVNIRRSLNDVSQQMEGFICENAIASAQADIAEKHYNHCKEMLQEAESRWAQGLAPTEEMAKEFVRVQWRDKMLKKANIHSQKKCFLIQRKAKSGTQIQARKWSPNRRELEDPNSSILGWNFSAVSRPPMKTPSLKFACRKSIK